MASEEDEVSPEVPERQPTDLNLDLFTPIEIRKLTLFRWMYSLEAAGFTKKEAGNLLFYKWSIETGRRPHEYAEAREETRIQRAAEEAQQNLTLLAESSKSPVNIPIPQTTPTDVEVSNTREKDPAAVTRISHRFLEFLTSPRTQIVANFVVGAAVALAALYLPHTRENGIIITDAAALGILAINGGIYASRASQTNNLEETKGI